LIFILFYFILISGSVRKSIARVLTVLTQKQRESLRLKYAKSKYVPTDLREKKTRAIRRRLTKHESSLVTERQKKKMLNNRVRKFAIKA
jgi:large subunit ribosomal protein L35e